MIIKCGLKTEATFMHYRSKEEKYLQYLVFFFFSQFAFFYSKFKKQNNFKLLLSRYVTYFKGNTLILFMDVFPYVFQTFVTE